MEEIKEVDLVVGKLFITELTISLVQTRLVHYIFGMTSYHKIEIVIRNSRCFQNLHKSAAAKKYLGYMCFEIPGGHLGIFWVGMCRPGLQIGTPF